MPKVSVIIPVYGVEPYIERCARSLFEQTLDDIEYIFVDDCTQDRSIEILENILLEYPERKLQVIIERMPKNSGQAAVRKLGIEKATGEYIIHCDSDDYTDTNMYKLMYEHAVKKNLDIVICSCFEFSCQTFKKTLIMDDDIIAETLTEQWGGVLWNKLVRREIAKSAEIIYPQDNYWEDLALATQYACLCHSYEHLDSPLYYYNHRNGSSLRSVGKDVHIQHTIQAANNYDIVIGTLRRKGLEKKLEYITLRRQLFIKNQLRYAMPLHHYSATYRNICRDANLKILGSPYISLQEKMGFILSFLGAFPIYSKILSFVRCH